jgi:hypothetical protein
VRALSQTEGKSIMPQMPHYIAVKCWLKKHRLPCPLQVKCQPVEDGNAPYPCERCIRMKLQCEDPRFTEANMDEVSTRMYNMIKLARVIGQQPDLTLERIKSLL